MIFTNTALFNGTIETGLRSLMILEAFYPKNLDLDSISLLDYFVVHTADLCGPESLHPTVSARVGEYRVRRKLIQEGLQMLIRISLVSVIEATDGIRFVSADDAPAFVKLLATDYNRNLSDRAIWLAQRAQRQGDSFFAEMRAYIDRWTLEFQADEGYASA
ncbi:hypothetical protein SAE02_11660 [Skermanella aerolata]|uniref:Threonine transporter n=1 Tax=Skermanella aerolata TaxID=393310 RepID=A0A512DKM8_9PROT|nr:ABC-three component system middle component 2 [Skermanella aerolata]KJB96835.1 threonine transporter [Skermanella aerolata KACC 11604]GEO37018.1 hypothetical protein SAE02_11660 [Skermanella aerolata]